MRHYTAEDGLWSSFINSMMRDSHGFMWFCTRDGLSRFDGYRFTNYRIGDGPASQNFTYMFESRDGIFWIVLGDKRLYRIDPRSVTNPTQRTQGNQANADDGRLPLHAELVSSTPVAGLLQDRNGNLWSGGGGLFLVKEEAGRASFREINLNLPQAWKPSFSVRAVAEGDDGSLWLGTSHGLFRRLSDGRVVRYIVDEHHGPDDVNFLLADKSGYIWVAHAGGDYVLKPEPLAALAPLTAFSSRQVTVRRPDLATPLPIKAGEAVDLATIKAFAGHAKETTDIYQQSDGHIWLVVMDRLVLFDGREFRSLSDARGGFRGLIEDLDGDLWITTYLGGVVRFSARGLMSYGPADGLGEPNVASIREDRDGRLHVLGVGWTISRLDDKKFAFVHANVHDAKALWSSNVGLLDHTGQWWFLTSRGLYRFAHARRLEDLARATPVLYTKLDGLSGRWVYCMFEDSRGDLWISVRETEQGVSGLVRWRRSDETFHRFMEVDGLPPVKSAASFAEDRAGNLWFGFYEGGLARFAAGRFTTFTPADGLPESFITALHLDHLGRLWMTSSSGGLVRIDDPTAVHPRFVHYTTREGLSSNNARALTEDLSGDIYVGTVRGIDRLTPETGRFRHYGLADGLAGDFVTTAYRDRKGTLWFGTFSGLSRLDPQPEPVPSAPSIRIEGLRIAGVEQPLSEFGASAVTGLELGSGQRNLQIDFSSLSMARAPLLRYQYELQGVDRDWSALTDQRTVHYANLAPGTYRFLVRAVDPIGLNSAQPASVEFRIFPPFWQRWWFLTLAAMAIGSAITWLYRYRVAHLLELERVRTHIATDLHDDIGSSLSQIAVLSEVVRRQVGSSAVSTPLSTIAATSRELVDSMSDIVWAINPNRDNLSDLSHRMRRFASDLFTANDIEFRFDAREPERPMKLDADVRRQVFLIFKESVHNIVRHSRCANVEVTLSIENHAISLVLKDDGKGFDAAQANHGHGLTSMNQRAKTLGATLEINSGTCSGTVVSLKVPLGRHPAALA
jgi:ligand-binding sensor domain-containing protein/two-component sensor histidine kinase